MHNKVYAVVLVGGKGKRLRPLSTAALPKAFLSITRDRKTMFRRTLDRIAGLVPDKNIIVVANRAHAQLVKKDFPNIGEDNLLLEPVSRNTAPAITLAASMIKDRAGDAIMVVLPTDQYITEEENFLYPVKCGIEFIKDNPSAIIVLGVKPRYPSTHFGYIKVMGQGAWGKDGVITKVKKFVEKPGRKRAEKYLRDGTYLWNTGAFIFKVDMLLRSVKKFVPKVYKIISHTGSIRAAYKKAPDISIDYAVIEKFRNTYCVKAEYEWHDLGGFESLIKVLAHEGRDFKLRGGKVVSIL